MRNAGLDETQAEIKISGRNINNLRYAGGTPEEPLDESERAEQKPLLKTQHSINEDHGIQSHHFMVKRWGNKGNSDRLYFLVLQNHCT